MCGVPYHAAETYINRLIERGHKVAICEQVEDPKKAKGLVKREVVRIVTPGTTLDAAALDETKNNYLMSIVSMEEHFGCAIADITTGDCFLTEVDKPQKLLDEINKFVCLLYTSGSAAQYIAYLLPVLILAAGKLIFRSSIQ